MSDGTPKRRYILAAALAALLSVYVTTFATQTHNRFDLPTWIDLTEWPATLLFLAAAVAAWKRLERPAALACFAALFAFFFAQGRFLFEVPLAFVVTSAATLGFLWLLPVTWKVR